MKTLSKKQSFFTIFVDCGYWINLGNLFAGLETGFLNCKQSTVKLNLFAAK